LTAGQVVIIQNNINIPRIQTEFRYDGRDKVLASYPISVVRGAYATEPGSLLAAGVEVLDTSRWGLAFEAPVGTDTGASSPAFELSVVLFMAKDDKTTVKLPSGQTVVLNQGESASLSVKIADRLVSDKPIQVYLITGDRDSSYELRCFSLIAVESFSTSYVSPVGDTRGRTRVMVYNPNSVGISVVFEHIDRAFRCSNYDTKTGRRTCTVASSRREQITMNIAAKQVMRTEVVNTDSGAWLSSTNPFLALSITDSDDFTQDGQGTGGQWYDWGFPVVPRSQLTSQVVVGLGFGCTNNS
jgi:IgGFc binding protein